MGPHGPIYCIAMHAKKCFDRPVIELVSRFEAPGQGCGPICQEKSREELIESLKVTLKERGQHRRGAEVHPPQRCKDDDLALY